MDNTISIFLPKTQVLLAQDINGYIERVSIGPALQPSYEIGWWNGREKKVAWFYDWEFTVCDKNNPRSIGICKILGFNEE
jgi:hypothetical protein